MAEFWFSWNIERLPYQGSRLNETMSLCLVYIIDYRRQKINRFIPIRRIQCENTTTLCFYRLFIMIWVGKVLVSVTNGFVKNQINPTAAAVNWKTEPLRGKMHKLWNGFAKPKNWRKNSFPSFFRLHEFCGSWSPCATTAIWVATQYTKKTLGGLDGFSYFSCAFWLWWIWNW